MSHPLDSVREKLKRADEHLERLEADTRTYLISEPYSFTGHREGAYHVTRIRVHKAVPLGLAVTLGDVLYQLRSALDHAAFACASLKGKPPKGTEFPVFRDKGEFLRVGRGGGMWKIRGVLPKQQAVIKALQPYHAGRDSISHPLWVLHELTNADKHRTLNYAGAIAESLSFQFDFDDYALGEPEIIPGPFVDGAVVCKVLAVQSGPQPRMQVQPSATFNITYDEGGLFGGRQIPNLIQLRDAANGAIDKIAAAI